MVSFLILLSVASSCQESQDALHETGEFRTLVDMNTTGKHTVSTLVAQDCFWVDGCRSPMRSPMDLIPFPIPDTQQKICINKPSQRCLVIEDVYFDFDHPVQVSDPTMCQQGTPCLIQNIVDIKISTGVNSSTTLLLLEWLGIFERFLDIQIPRNFSLARIFKFKNATSIFILWFKPIYLVVAGSYQESKKDKIFSINFRAKLPLFNKAKYLNGIAGIEDLCSQHPSKNSNQIHTKYNKLVAIKDFYCRSKKY
ncbi:hypothetical protein DSO57_1011922 [Entomophthora muscae]|uniref:Uncharacterized protein n=1 Tax=Entomophthora muscae TaxID=34485 RepID=A0ACC2T6I7_9FUNG|nr:hypothetical protein DSO57_1011922 [Entomophthora muscae]